VINTEKVLTKSLFLTPGDPGKAAFHTVFSTVLPLRFPIIILHVKVPLHQRLGAGMKIINEHYRLIAKRLDRKYSMQTDNVSMAQRGPF